MLFQGNIDKMPVVLGEPVQYSLVLGSDVLSVNEHLGHRISLRFNGQINCVVCGKVTKKVFGQGFCYPCFNTSPDNSDCILRPELCEGHLGKGRDPQWELEKHVQPHFVYLALTSAIKVGVTRRDNVPSRWIDQGAWKVIRFAETPYRQLAGEIEVFLKGHLTDKTDWRKMLKDDRDLDADLVDEKNRLLDLLPAELGEFFCEDDEVVEIHYPVLEYPSKVSSLTFDKESHIEGTLIGIRGQYLILDGGRVLNLRRHSGYWIEVEV